jgi:hypothetical protein
MDRKRPKGMRNEEWVNPAVAEAEITRLKMGAPLWSIRPNKQWI